MVAVELLHNMHVQQVIESKIILSLPRRERMILYSIILSLTTRERMILYSLQNYIECYSY